MVELFVWLVSGLFLFFVGFLVLQEVINRRWIRLPLPHPRDKVMHFATCLLGVVFIFISMQKLYFGFEVSLMCSVVVMLTASLYKECFIDNPFSWGDMVSNILGLLVASITLFFVY